MARVLAIHHDKEHLKRLAAVLQAHEFVAIDNLVNAVRYIPKVKPDVIVVGHEKEKREGLRLLYYMRDNAMSIPVVVVMPPGGSDDEIRLAKLGARQIIEQPVSLSDMDAAIEACMEKTAERLAGPRPITQEELSSNISILESNLNRNMQCFAGKNQVFLHSVILGGGMRTKPRVALRCPLRAEYGLEKLVYYEYIRDVCCQNPESCEAYRKFRSERESA